MDDKKATNEKVVGDIGAGGSGGGVVKGFKNSRGDDSARGVSDNGSYGRNSQNDEYGGGGGGSEVRIITTKSKSFTVQFLFCGSSVTSSVRYSVYHVMDYLADILVDILVDIF